MVRILPNSATWRKGARGCLQRARRPLSQSARSTLLHGYSTHLSTFPPFHFSTRNATGGTPVVPVVQKGSLMSGFEIPPPPAPNAEKGAGYSLASMSGMLDLSRDEKAKHFLPRWLSDAPT